MQVPTMTYYTVYQTTDLINGKIYVGTHKTDNPYDDYLGSGKYVVDSIEKNGKENFQKEVLHIFDSPEEMFAKEAEIVNEDFISREDTYNIKEGGYGGWDHISTKELWEDPEIRERMIKGITKAYENPEYSQKISKALSDKWKDPEYYAMRMEQANDLKFRKKHSESLRKRWASSEERKLQSEKLKKARSGKDNPLNKKQSELVKDTIWIYNPQNNVTKRIKRDSPIPEGFIKGRPKSK